MFSIERCPVPANTLLEGYLTRGAYVDAYTTELPGQVTLPQYLFAFYTTPLFRLERLILKLVISRPSTDVQAKAVAEGRIDEFAAWTVEARREDEILMCDLVERTRSWFMVIPAQDARTRLYFGSAVVPKAGRATLELGFRALLRFHQLYSVLLLWSARDNLQRTTA